MGRGKRARRIGVAALWIGALAVGVACASIRPQADWDREVAFDTLDSFAIVETEDSGVDATGPQLSELTLQRARRGTSEILRNAGYLEVARERADFWVAIHVASREKIEVWSSPTFGSSYRGLYLEGRTNATTYTEGTLVIDVLEAGSRRLLWRGWVSEPVNRRGPSPERIRAVSQAILDQFPPLPDGSE